MNWHFTFSFQNRSLHLQASNLRYGCAQFWFRYGLFLFCPPRFSNCVLTKLYLILNKFLLARYTWLAEKEKSTPSLLSPCKLWRQPARALLPVHTFLFCQLAQSHSMSTSFLEEATLKKTTSLCIISEFTRSVQSITFKCLFQHKPKLTLQIRKWVGKAKKKKNSDIRNTWKT